MTQAGVILGTAAYMSPEQARAQRVDKRTDIWAFGVVLFEMLTGRRAFARDNVSDTIASVLKVEPDWLLLPEETPAVIRRLLQRCLAKDRRDRLADIGDVRLDLVDAMTSPGGAEVDSTGKSARLPWSVAIALATALLVALAAVPSSSLVRHQLRRLCFTARLRPRPTLESSRSDLPWRCHPTADTLPLRPPMPAEAGCSGSAGSINRRLRPLSGTEGAEAPFWSADSRFVAFVAGGSLKKVDILGGPAVIVAPSAAPFPGSWNRDDVILFNSSSTQILRVSAAGGTPSPATRIDAQTGQRPHSFPFFLPDGRSFLYLEDSRERPPRPVRWRARLRRSGRSCSRTCRTRSTPLAHCCFSETRR